jgi:hypothetical protein
MKRRFIESHHPASASRLPASGDLASNGKDLREYIVDAWKCGRLFNKDVCVLSDLITKAGGVGVSDLAKPDGDKGDNYSRHLQSALHLQEIDNKLYTAYIPLWDKAQNKQVQKPVQFQLVHEKIAELWTAGSLNISRQDS